MADSNVTPPALPPIPATIEIKSRFAFSVEPDHEHGLVDVIHATEPNVAWITLAPEDALETALRLIGAVVRLRKPPSG